MNSTLELDESQTSRSASPDHARPSYTENARTVSASASSGHRAFVTAIIDRWIYVFMAGLFVVTTLAGFIPDSIVNEERKDVPRLAIVNTGAIRFDIFQGAFTRDSTYLISPFVSKFNYIADVPYAVASKVL